MCRKSMEPKMMTSSNDNTARLLTEEDLIDRWRGKITRATLITWRSRRVGPRFVKVGRQALYPVADVEAYEASRTRTTR